MAHQTATVPYPILYFGYGSNLWLEQMCKRCPTSQYAGLARLPGYRWLISERGYANVLQTNSPDDSVFGLVFLLEKDDEDRLDKNEGVPWAYQKMMLTLDFWPAPLDTETKSIDAADETKSQKKTMLVYVDPIRVHDGQPWDEYIFRMNMGIKDALKLGIPESYVDKVLRKYIPPETKTGDENVKTMAEKQAERFIDQNK